MNCTEARALFSDYVERSLAPLVQAGVGDHVARCTVCARELQAFARTLDAVRRTRLDPPPARLAAAVMAAMPAGGRPGRRPAAPLRALAPWIAAAGAFLVACWLAVAGARSERELLALRGSLEEQVSEAQVQARTARSSEASARRAESAARAAGASTAAALDRLRVDAEKARAAFEERILRLETDAASHAGAVEELHRKLSDAEALAVRLEKGASGRREPTSVQSPAPERTPRAPALAADEARPAPDEPAPHVVLLEAGDRLELQARGSRDEVVPELFAMADGSSDSDAADLAIHALERYLDPTGEKVSALEALAMPHGALARWWNQRIEGFANATGTGEPAAADAPSEKLEFGRRLETLRAIWRKESGSKE